MYAKSSATWLAAGLVAWAAAAPAEEIDYGADLTAEQLLDSWLAPPELVLPPPAPWKLDLTARAGGGYKENVLFSAVREQNSAFSLAEVDAFLYRESDSPDQFYLYGFADQRHYFDLDRGDNEHLAVAEASWTRTFREPGAVNLRGTYSFIDQFFDASLSDTETDAIRLFQHDAGLRGHVEKEIAPRLTLRLGGGANRVDVRDLDDDYRRWRGLARLEYSCGPRGKAGVSLEHDRDDYAERPRRTATGEPLDGNAVAIAAETLTLYAQRNWDADRRWQTRLTLTGRWRDDDGGGYYDDRSWRASLLLRGPVAGCRWEAGLYYGDTDYDVRPAIYGAVAGPHLYRSVWRTRFRLERDLGLHASLFAEVSHEDNDSNDPLDVYTQTWAVLGAGYRL